MQSAGRAVSLRGTKGCNSGRRAVEFQCDDGVYGVTLWRRHADFDSGFALLERGAAPVSKLWRTILRAMGGRWVSSGAMKGPPRDHPISVPARLTGPQWMNMPHRRSFQCSMADLGAPESSLAGPVWVHAGNAAITGSE